MYKITLSSGSTHILESLDLDAYTSSINTKQALEGAISIGNVEEFTPEQIQEYNPKNFKISFLNNSDFRDWQETLPAIDRENLKLAAMADNWELVQILYTGLSQSYTPTQDQKTSWQQIADDHNIPLTFT